MNFSRRKFLKMVGLGLAAMAASSGMLALYGTQVEPARVQVREQPIHLPRLRGEGLRGARIVQISDIHMGSWMNPARLAGVVDKVLDLAPMAVAITGDFLTRLSDHPRDIQDLAAALERLGRSASTYAVMGNHDYWHGVDALREMLEDVGIKELRNNVRGVKRGNSILYLAGVDDIWEERDRLDKVLAELPPEDAAILMAHEPDFADISAASGRFDLQISGHSHGGQVVLPFIGPPVLPHLAEKYPAGLYRVGNMWQYTNRGVGTSLLELRINCPPEITVFRFE